MRIKGKAKLQNSNGEGIFHSGDFVAGNFAGNQIFRCISFQLTFICSRRLLCLVQPYPSSPLHPLKIFPIFYSCKISQLSPSNRSLHGQNLKSTWRSPCMSTWMSPCVQVTRASTSHHRERQRLHVSQWMWTSSRSGCSCSSPSIGGMEATSNACRYSWRFKANAQRITSLQQGRGSSSGDIWTTYRTTCSLRMSFPTLRNYVFQIWS